MTTMSFPMVPIGEVLTKSNEWIEIDPNERYRQVTVRLWGKGVLLRDEVSGAEIAASRQLVVHSKQFIVSRIDARNGAFGLIPDSLDGALVSSDFPVFAVNPSRIHPKYLEWMSKTHFFVDICKAASEGTTNRVRLKEDRFLMAKIPLPALSEQRRIVTRIEELAAKIGEAQRLRKTAGEETEALIKSEMSHVFDINNSNYQIESLETLADRIADIDHSMPKATENGVKLVSPKDFTPIGIDFRYCKHISREDFERLRKKIQPQLGDILFSRIGTIGQARLVETDEEFIASYSIVTIRPNMQRFLPKYLLYALQSPAVLNQARSGVRGIAMPDLGIKTIRGFLIPAPPLPEQRHIVAYLDELQAKVDALRHLQAETGAEMDALMPAVLDKAFKGEM